MARTKLATKLPAQQPTSVSVSSPAARREAIKGKYVPRDPKDGEVMLTLVRPQTLPSGSFLEYAAGDLISHRWARLDAALKAEWITDAVYDLAVQIVTASDDLMPILADALADAGCQDEAILSSLRAKERKGWAGKIVAARPMSYVVTAAKPGYTRTWSQGGKAWEQIVVARRATAADHEAVSGQQAAHDAESRRVMDRMMNS